MKRTLLAALAAFAISSCATVADTCVVDGALLSEAQALHSPEMDAAIAAAQPGVPRK